MELIKSTHDTSLSCPDTQEYKTNKYILELDRVIKTNVSWLE